MADISSNKSTYLQSYYDAIIAFGKLSYINGGVFYFEHNEMPDWGTAPDEDTGIQHTYNPKLAYINQVVTQLTSGKNSTIVNYGVIMRLLTQDGNLDYYTINLDDSSEINNDGRIYNFPDWIPGPHG